MGVIKSHGIGVKWLKLTGLIKPQVGFPRNPCKENKQNMPIKKPQTNQQKTPNKLNIKVSF